MLILKIVIICIHNSDLPFQYHRDIKKGYLKIHLKHFGLEPRVSQNT